MTTFSQDLIRLSKLQRKIDSLHIVRVILVAIAMVWFSIWWMVW